MTHGLGHMTKKGLMILGRLGVLKGMEKPSIEFCEHYIYGKRCRVQFHTSKSKSRNILDYVHSDVWGPTKQPSKGGSSYYVSFIDDYSRYTWVYFLKTKDQVFEKFKEWKALVENRTGQKVKMLRSDNGNEYNNGPFLQFCSQEGIARHWSVLGTPHQNGVAERFNRTVLERARCLILNAGLGKEWWAEAIVAAAYLMNRSPHASHDGKTPYESGQESLLITMGSGSSDALPIIMSKKISLMQGRRRLSFWGMQGYKRLQVMES